MSEMICSNIHPEANVNIVCVGAMSTNTKQNMIKKNSPSSALVHLPKNNLAVYKSSSCSFTPSIHLTVGHWFIGSTRAAEHMNNFICFYIRKTIDKSGESNPL